MSEGSGHKALLWALLPSLWGPEVLGLLPTSLGAASGVMEGEAEPLSLRLLVSSMQITPATLRMRRSVATPRT